MAQNIGTLVTAPIRMNDTTIPAPVAYANEIQGGLQTVSTLALLQGIPLWLRAWGMECRVYNDATTSNNGKYVLTFGNTSTNLADNGNWVLATSSSGVTGNLQKLDQSILNSGSINIPANSILLIVMVDAAADLPAFNVGFTSGAGDLIMTQDASPGYNPWTKNIFLPGATTIYFTGVIAQSVCSVIIATF